MKSIFTWNIGKKSPKIFFSNKPESYVPHHLIVSTTEEKTKQKQKNPRQTTCINKNHHSNNKNRSPSIFIQFQSNVQSRTILFSNFILFFKNFSSSFSVFVIVLFYYSIIYCNLFISIKITGFQVELLIWWFY